VWSPDAYDRAWGRTRHCRRSALRSPQTPSRLTSPPSQRPAVALCVLRGRGLESVCEQ
jgi:hypothetical protein